MVLLALRFLPESFTLVDVRPKPTSVIFIPAVGLTVPASAGLMVSGALRMARPMSYL